MTSFNDRTAAKQQCAVVLNHLRQFGRMTSFDAIDRYNITRLAARVYELRKKGYPIKTGRMVNPVGHDYAMYTLEEVASND